MFDCSRFVSCALTSKFVGQVEKKNKYWGVKSLTQQMYKLTKGKPNTKLSQPEAKLIRK